MRMMEAAGQIGEAVLMFYDRGIIKAIEVPMHHKPATAVVPIAAPVVLSIK
jgi:hypothetical protein